MEVTVKATKPGFDGTKRRAEGEVFTIDVDGRSKAALGSWMERVEVAAEQSADEERGGQPPDSSEEG